MIIDDGGEYDSRTEGELEALDNVAQHWQVNDDEVDQVFFDNDSGPTLVISKILTIQQPKMSYLSHQRGNQ